MRSESAFLIVMGVSGCGKSTVGAMVAERLGWFFEDADAFHSAENIAKMRAGHALTDNDRRPWLSAVAAWMDEARSTGTRAVIACSALKRDYRAILIGEHRDVRLVYLKGSPELIARRMRRRHGHFMPASLLATQFATLEEPTQDEDPIVVSIEPAPAQIADTIVAEMRRDSTPEAGLSSP